MATNPSWMLAQQQRAGARQLLKGLWIFGAEEESGSRHQWRRLVLPVTGAQTLLASSTAEEKI